MRIARQREAAFSYLNSPKPNELNALQLAVYNGRIDKVRRLIAPPASPGGPDVPTPTPALNIYQHCDLLDMSLLYLAIARDHIELANEFLTIYEQDFGTIERFFVANGFASDYAWVKQPILVACGTEQVREARRLCAELNDTTALPEQRTAAARLIVLCKRSNRDTNAEVIWCSAPKSAVDIPKNARLIRALYTKGCLRFYSDGFWRNVQFLAASRNYREIYMRMVNTWGQHLTSATTYLTELMQLCSYCPTDPVAYFEELLHELGVDKFRFHDGHLRNRRSVLIEPLTTLEQFDLFEWMMRSLAEERQRAHGGTLEENLKYLAENPEDKGSVFQDCVLYDRVPEAIKVIALCKPDLLRRPSEAGGDDQTGQMVLLITGHKTNATVMQWILDGYEEMRTNYPDLLREVICTLVEHDWADGLRTLYAKHPDTIKQFFLAAEITEDRNQLLNKLDSDRYEAVEFLLHEHRDQFTTAELVGDFIWYCASSARAANALEVSLRLPGAAVATQAKGHAMWAALRYRQRPNYRRVLATVEDAAELLRNHRQEYGGDTLLHVAVWYHIDVVDEEPFVYEPDAQIALEIPDSEDDEAVAEEKRALNVKLCSGNGPITGVVAVPAEYYAQEEADYRVIFEELIAANCDVHAVNEAGETLCHLAVKYDNYFVLDKLLALGVDPLRADAVGTLPVHLCKTSAMLQRLLQCAGIREQLRQPDNAGATVLHRYVKDSAKSAKDDAEADAFVAAVIEAGADVNAKNKEAGDTALHLAAQANVKNVIAALLTGGADVNARNATGETPLHQMYECSELIRLAGDQLDWLAICDKGFSILSALIGLSADETDQLAPVFDKHAAVLRQLFAKYSLKLDKYGRTALSGLSRNLPWTRRFVADGGLGESVDATAMRLNFETGDEAERLLTQWLIRRDVDFAYLAADIQGNRYDYPTPAGWNMLFELGANVRLDADGCAKALRNDRLRDDRTGQAVDAIAGLLERGADMAPLCEGNWYNDNVLIFGSLKEWYKMEKVE